MIRPPICPGNRNRYTYEESYLASCAPWLFIPDQLNVVELQYREQVVARLNRPVLVLYLPVNLC